MKARAGGGVREKRIIRGCLGLNPRSLSSRRASWHQSPREIVSLECEPYAVAKIEKNRRASRARRAPNVSRLSSRLSCRQTITTRMRGRMNKFSSSIFFPRADLRTRESCESIPIRSVTCNINHGFPARFPDNISRYYIRRNCERKLILSWFIFADLFFNFLLHIFAYLTTLPSRSIKTKIFVL